MSSDRDFQRRLAAVERKLNGDGNGTNPPFRILRIEGGLPGPINWSYAGQHQWKREPAEELEAFVERTAQAARAAGETSLIVGGLPRSDELDEFKTFEEWWATIAPDYPDVPPEEAPGFVPRRSPFGADR
jgi:hypothetical protein